MSKSFFNRLNNASDDSILQSFHLDNRLMNVDFWSLSTSDCWQFSEMLLDEASDMKFEYAS